MRLLFVQARERSGRALHVQRPVRPSGGTGIPVALPSSFEEAKHLTERLGASAQAIEQCVAIVRRTRRVVGRGGGRRG
jgi:hypothetical protein